MATKQQNPKQYYLTKEGLEERKKELDYLINVEREHVAERISEAKAYGDLSENAEYENAKEQQAFTEGRIADLQIMIKNHVVIDEPHAGGKVALGSTVAVKVNGKDKEQYTIVGSAEADPMEGKISNESPIGSVLMGKKKGDAVKAIIPSGKLDLEILSVS